MEFRTERAMARRVYELYRTHQIDENGLANAVAKNWITQDEANQIREAMKETESEK